MSKVAWVILLSLFCENSDCADGIACAAGAIEIADSYIFTCSVPLTHFLRIILLCPAISVTLVDLLHLSVGPRIRSL